MSDKNYQARMRRLTASDSYGPMYRKLTKTDQKLINDLVQRNAGGQARAELKDFDRQRRARVAQRSKIRRRVDKFNNLPDDERTRRAGLDINEDNDKAFWQQYENKHPDKYSRAA